MDNFLAFLEFSFWTLDEARLSTSGIIVTGSRETATKFADLLMGGFLLVIIFF